MSSMSPSLKSMLAIPLCNLNYPILTLMEFWLRNLLLCWTEEWSTEATRQSLKSWFSRVMLILKMQLGNLYFCFSRDSLISILEAKDALQRGVIDTRLRLKPGFDKPMISSIAIIIISMLVNSIKLAYYVVSHANDGYIIVLFHLSCKQKMINENYSSSTVLF